MGLLTPRASMPAVSVAGDGGVTIVRCGMSGIFAAAAGAPAPSARLSFCRTPLYL